MGLESISPDVARAFAASAATTIQWAGVTGVAGALGGAMALALPAVSRFVLPTPRETRLADHLPFEAILPDGMTIACHDGTLLRMLEASGRDTTFLTPGERDGYFLMRKSWLDAVAESGAMIRVFSIRDRISIRDTSEHDNAILRAMAKRWNHSFAESYRNRQIIVISINGKSKMALQKLTDAVEMTKSLLHAYSPMPLSQHDSDPLGRPLTIWARLVSPISRPFPAGTGRGVSDMITADQVEFTRDKGLIRFRSGSYQMYAAAIGLRRLGDFTEEDFVADIMTIPAELVMFHLVEPWNRLKAALLVKQHNNMSLASRFSTSTAEQFDFALNMIEGNDESASALAAYAMTIFIYGDTEDEIDDIEAEIKRICANYGVTSVREGVTAQPAWFSQFPSYGVWPRTYRLFSGNIASHMTLERPLEGLPRCDWGEGPIARFRTAMGTAYDFQFHITMDKAAVAHAVAIGPTGGGKTTLVNFLAGMAMRHNRLRVYMVDRHGGAFIFTNAIGGNYIVFEGSNLPGRVLALNPFQISDTVENRSFLRGFLQALADMNDPDAIEEIGFAIEAAFETPGLPRDKRSLANLHSAVFNKSKAVYKALHKWVDPAVFGNVFNAAQDTMDLTSTRMNAFDFTRLYEHEELARAVILYLMHRIQGALGELRSPAIIFIDETEPVVRHPMFRNFFMQMLQEYRKRGAAVISAFQRPEAIAQAGLGEAIRGQAQTTFFFPNPQAQEREYADWGLTDREWAYIKGRLGMSRRLRRSVMVKRAGGESVILDTDLSPIGPYLRIFYSDEPSKQLAEDLMRRHQGDWIKHYIAEEVSYA